MAANDDSRGTLNRGTENRGIVPGSRAPKPLRQAQQQPAAVNAAVAQPLPPATHRTIFVVQNDFFFQLPQDIRDVAIDEMTAAWDFVGVLDAKHPMKVVQLKPDQFPQAMAFSDAVVTIEFSEAEVTAHVTNARRLQFANAQESLRQLNVNFQPPAIGHSTTVFEAGGQGGSEKQLITAGQRSFALPVMSSAVSFESLMAEVVVELEAKTTNAKTGKYLERSLSFYGHHEALRVASMHIAIENPTDPTKWSGNERELLGRILGRSMAHEVRHCYMGSAHAIEGLGTDSPLLFDQRFFRFSQQDEKDILAEIRSLEKQQAGATLVETFPATRRSEFPF